MNRERIRALIEDLKTGEDFELDMEMFGISSEKPKSPNNLCGTVCCLAGLICLRDGRAEMIPKGDSGYIITVPQNSVWIEATEILDLEIFEARCLFFPSEDRVISRQRAIEVLEELLETGRANW